MMMMMMMMMMTILVMMMMMMIMMMILNDDSFVFQVSFHTADGCDCEYSIVDNCFKLAKSVLLHIISSRMYRFLAIQSSNHVPKHFYVIIVFVCNCISPPIYICIIFPLFCVSQYDSTCINVSNRLPCTSAECFFIFMACRSMFMALSWQYVYAS